MTIVQIILSKHPYLTPREAAAMRDQAAVRRFVQRGASPNDTGSSKDRWTPLGRSLLGVPEVGLCTPLEMALRGGDTAVVGLRGLC